MSKLSGHSKVKWRKYGLFSAIVLALSYYFALQYVSDHPTDNCTDVLAGTPSESNFCTEHHLPLVVWHRTSKAREYSYQLISSGAAYACYDNDYPIVVASSFGRWQVAGQPIREFGSAENPIVRYFAGVPSWLPEMPTAGSFSVLRSGYSNNQTYNCNIEELATDWMLQQEYPNLPDYVPHVTTMSPRMIAEMKTNPDINRLFEGDLGHVYYTPRMYSQYITRFYAATVHDKNGHTKQLNGTWRLLYMPHLSGYWDFQPFQ